jgi:5-methylcytosine-specific restriction endonuclease McrA
MSGRVASYRLMRALLFKLVRETGAAGCYRCGKQIETLASLSVDHKVPWLDNAEAFWDLENIAFSHRGCNSGARRSSGRKYRDAAERSRVGFREWYSRPENSSQWNQRRRERYAQRQMA